jgi:hypothetical protein
MKQQGLLCRHHLLIVALAGLVAGACRPSTTSQDGEGRYIVTAEPINIGVGSGRFCIAADPADPQGAWWWEPGPKGCSSRSTGPAVFHAENATVSPSKQGGATDIRFRVGLHTAANSSSPPFADVWIVLADGRMRALATGAQVSTVRRKDLDVPESWR